MKKSIKGLTRKQLKGLRAEICLNSLFIGDYQNSLNIDPVIVCDFFDGFIVWGLEEQDKNIDFIDQLDNIDNIDNLWNYYKEYISLLQY